MDILSLLFSFEGRIGRLKYFVSSFVAGLVALVLLGVTVGTSGIFGGGLQNLFNISASSLVMLLLIFTIGFWVQAALVWKRVRDMSDSMMVAYLWLSFSLLSFIPLLGLLASVGVVVMVGIFSAKPSKDEPANSSFASVFGEIAETISEPSTPTGSLDELSDQDLVARARQLREKEQVAVAPKAIKTERSTPQPAGFGRRTGLTSNAR